jgi:hypothetical protein
MTHEVARLQTSICNCSSTWDKAFDRVQVTVIINYQYEHLGQMHGTRYEDATPISSYHLLRGHPC